MEAEAKKEAKTIGKDAPSPQTLLDTLPLEEQSKKIFGGREISESVEKENKLDLENQTVSQRRQSISKELPLKDKEEETLVLKMNDGRTVTCQLVCNGKEKYLKEIPTAGSEESTSDLKMTPDTKLSSFSQSSQFVSSVNSLLEENAVKVEPGSESYKRTTLELFEPIPSRFLKKQQHSQQWTEQGRRLASFVEDSIYRSLKSNDAEVVKEWQLKMTSETFRDTLSEDSKVSNPEKHLNDSADGNLRSNFCPQSSLPLQRDSDAMEVAHSMSESNLAKNGKVSLLDVLREKLRRTLLNYDQQVKQDSQSVTRSIDTLFFSPAVESTTPDSQSAMPSSSDDVFRETDPQDGYCDGDSGSNSTDESCSDRPSSTQSAIQATSTNCDNLTPRGEGSTSECALDLSCSSHKVKERDDVSTRKRPSTSDFSLERILARPDPKPKRKHNPFMQTFSDLLDLPPREIKNREPFKVKRRPYRRRRGMHQGQFSKPVESGENISETENGVGHGAYEQHPPPRPSNVQAPIGYLAITEDEYQRSLATASNSPDADWPSVALLMNVYSEWKLKNRGMTPSSHLSSELGGHSMPGQSIPTAPAMNPNKPSLPSSSSSSSNSQCVASKGSVLSQNVTHRTSCSADCSSRSSGHFYSKKSRLLQNVERGSCNCRNHSRKGGPQDSVSEEEVSRSSIRSLLKEKLDKKVERPEVSNSECDDSDDSELRIKRARVSYREENDVPLSRDPDGQGVCVIS
ncbi:hypothetical protein HOLleu_41019 [Holothuria leucospilota]|uniref:Uncharacterized protein n=1 Tax=Holothuria leucospilota TaxID=206669 RepID=A0A9Q1BBK2_HOLLE|nr:hypothetical protein HOLleu_41019 [Holothuria leucospilota]